jgi:hypothetical protein
VEFWQEKYEKAMRTIRKMKRRYPHDLLTLSDEETEEFTPHSLPHKMATRAPPTYVIPNDVEDQD